MKKFRFLLTAILFAIVLCAVSACGKDIVKLSFETNGGSSIETVEVKKGESYELPVPTRTGFEFDGWFTDANFPAARLQAWWLKTTLLITQSGRSFIQLRLTLTAARFPRRRCI